jgi:hypothetical protein
VNRELFLWEAYLAKYTNSEIAAPPFTVMTHQGSYSDNDWRDAEKRWHKKTLDERNAVRRESESQYANLNRMGDELLADVFFASWNWNTYFVAALIAAGLVVVIRWDERTSVV